MHNKTSLMVETLVAELKRNPNVFGNVVSAETKGFNFTAADVASHIDGKTEVYRVVVVKHAN